ncbi:restriction endonuclease subunit S [Vibrio sp. TRT 21S02]|uniref:restriction endonuclease subunit S n=1 Tax=Vibrio sp. TRT 21S02 TaxID=3418507 RepID=UPI003CF27ABD
MSGLPKGWALSKIKEAIFLNEKHIGVDDSTECGFVPMALVPTRYGDAIEFEKRNWERCKKGYTQFQDNDVILAKITPCFENGKSALVTGLPNGIGAGSTEYFVLRSVGNLVHSKYLHAFVKTKDFLINCETNMSGSVGHRRVPKDYLLDYPFPLAPLAEQKRIVEKLDEVLAQVDTIKARLDGIPDLLKRFRQSVLASAVSGKLTEEWRELQKVSVLWRDITLKDAAHIQDPHPSHRTPKVVEGGVPYVSTGDLREDGSIDFEGARKVSFDILKEHNERYTLKEGDFIFGKIGTLGKATVLPMGIDYTLSANVILIQPELELTIPKYIQYFLSSPTTMEEIARQANSTSQAAFGIKKMRAFSCSLPTKEEQKEIVRLVDQYFAFADTIEAQVKKAQQRVDNLTQSILAKAFRGELVPQDPSDEPADKLLERIAQARAEAEALAKAAKKVKAAKKRAAKA